MTQTTTVPVVRDLRTMLEEIGALAGDRTEKARVRTLVDEVKAEVDELAHKLGHARYSLTEAQAELEDAERYAEPFGGDPAGVKRFVAGVVALHDAEHSGIARWCEHEVCRTAYAADRA